MLHSYVYLQGLIDEIIGIENCRIRVDASVLGEEEVSVLVGCKQLDSKLEWEKDIQGTKIDYAPMETSIIKIKISSH